MSFFSHAMPFHYTDNGPEGLVTGKPLTVITSRGGDYSEGSPAAAFDYLQPYLQTAFGFIGFRDIAFINAQGMDSGSQEQKDQRLINAQEQARQRAQQTR
jgi:FMN-dependent NADH-azoreductase